MGGQVYWFVDGGCRLWATSDGSTAVGSGVAWLRSSRFSLV